MPDKQQSKESVDLRLFINEQYVSVRKIGNGGFGVVWQVYDFSLRNFIAVKELLSEFSHVKFVEKFYKEALIARNIIHDNIVRVHHFWKGCNGSYYILMDFVNGVDLKELIKRCNEYQIKIPWEFSVLICINILKALDYINRIARDPITNALYTIVYRDISPDNILISFDGSVKLSDFGIVKIADEMDEGIKQKVITGKYPYMSPEQVKGDFDVDHRSDIFSVGVIFYEMLTGQQLYTGTNDKIKSKIVNTEFDINLLNGLDFPSEIADIIIKTLKKDRNLRYEFAIEMCRDLKKVLKYVETGELTSSFSSFVSKVMDKELETADNIVDLVKSLDIQKVKDDSSIVKVVCNEFIVEEIANSLQHQLPSQIRKAEASDKNTDENIKKNNEKNTYGGIEKNTEIPQLSSHSEAKGITVFEEAGDWFAGKFKNFTRKIIKVFFISLFMFFIFLSLDTFILQMTPLGLYMYSLINPPDVIITTTPANAVVSMKSKDGKFIIQDQNSKIPITIKKVKPQTYIITAVKDGFKPLQRIVNIEGKTKSDKNKQEKIDLIFDFVLGVDSDPQGTYAYIDGNKFGVTPCKIELTAGEHTVKLALEGYESLGFDAKESKEGQCNIDFSKLTEDEILANVDKNYWETELQNTGNINVFGIKGHMYKQFSFLSEPSSMTVHIEGESQPRGNTPLTTNMKAGIYKVRMLDPKGYYGEVLKEINVSSNTPNELNIFMDKNISFRVKTGNISKFFKVKIEIDGEKFKDTKDIISNKATIIPIPVGKYKFTFTADKFKPFVKNNVDIEKINSINVEMVYVKIPYNISVVYINKNSREIPLKNASILLNGKIAGKTNEKGVWTNKAYIGTDIKGNVEAVGFMKHQFKFTLLSDTHNSQKITLIPKASSKPVSTNTAVTNINPLKPPPEKTKHEDKNIRTVVCSHCGYVNTTPLGRKLRFCVNCARSLKY